MGASVILPAGLVMLLTKGLLFAKTDDRDLGCRDPQGSQIPLGRLCPSFSKGEVIVRRAPFITMTLDNDLFKRLPFEGACILVEGPFALLPNHIPVKIKVDVVDH